VRRVDKVSAFLVDNRDLAPSDVEIKAGHDDTFSSKSIILKIKPWNGICRELIFQHLQQLNLKRELMLYLNRLIARCIRLLAESAQHLDAAFACRDLFGKIH
jgi:hypothetical protein